MPQMSTSNRHSKVYKGVRKRKWGKYVCEIRRPNSRGRIWLGSYDSAKKAARAFDAAQFCLRGQTANLNFPDDPPDIAVWQAMTSTQIQVAAQRYANEYVGDSSEGSATPAPAPAPPSPGAKSVGRPTNPIDWSFLETLDTDGPWEGYFGVFSDMNDVYVPPEHGANAVGHRNDCEDDGYVTLNFLWNY